MGARLGSAVLAVLAATAVAASGFWLGAAGGPHPDVVRVHVFAHSDRPADQQLKELVRLAVLGYLERIAPELERARHPADAEAVLLHHRRQIRELAREVLRRAGSPYDVWVGVGTHRFAARPYGGGVLPAGYYRALVIRIGAGTGHNWWCLAFPPTCLSPAVLAELRSAPPPVRAALRQLDAGGQRVEVRLRLVDWLGGRWRAWRGRLASAHAQPAR